MGDTRASGGRYHLGPCVDGRTGSTKIFTTDVITIDAA